ncbi:MAG: carboxylating nicotinate-nucleotide diphosphorylase [Verrucomicrobiales bacterium]|nr:carboxylating nicotinate-nucleotide diphosphorylase [Verrucomicrobiales bacterium]
MGFPTKPPPARPDRRRVFVSTRHGIPRPNRRVVPLPPGELTAWVRSALAEDLGSGDVTTDAVIPASARWSARMVAREPMVLAGLELALAAFRELDPAMVFRDVLADGQAVEARATLAVVEGSARALLSAERVALNMVQRLSGIATQTARYVKALHGTRTRILDTRKTTPGWRRLEKYAVACGGGTNHRQGLDDLVLIKDNHRAALREALPNPIAAAVARARACHHHLRIEVEADTLEQVRQALDAGADIILLDNMGLDDLRTAAAWCHGRALTEASGGVTLERLPAIAATGVDFISSGALTHAARWVDIGLDFDP